MQKREGERDLNHPSLQEIRGLVSVTEIKSRKDRRILRQKWKEKGRRRAIALVVKSEDIKETCGDGLLVASLY